MRDSESQAVCHAPDLITNHIFFLNNYLTNSEKNRHKNKNTNIYIVKFIILYIHFLNIKEVYNMFKRLLCFNIHSINQRKTIDVYLLYYTHIPCNSLNKAYIHV